MMIVVINLLNRKMMFLMFVPVCRASFEGF